VAATFICATKSRAASGRELAADTARSEDYSAPRHGYTTIGSKFAGIEASTRYFVPLDENSKSGSSR